MLKATLLILFAMSSSAALAQHHVPGGGPVGSPGNPGTHHPGGGYPGGGYGGGTHVPGGGPVGSPGNPGTYHPHGPVIVVTPNYPNYPSYPNGNNTNYVGPCVINSYYSSNYQYYTVTDGRGYTVQTTSDYYVALNTAQQYQSYGYCRGLINNAQPNYPQPNPYPNPNPNPYPQPYPQPVTYCQIMPGRDAYGNNFYRVLDRAGRIILNTANYAEAVNVSRMDQRCFQ